MTDELKECPFCYNKARLNTLDGGLTAWVECVYCGCSVHGMTDVEAVTRWNTRTQPTPAVDDVERVARALCENNPAIAKSMTPLYPDDKIYHSDKGLHYYWEGFIPQAKAAIGAMPSPANTDRALLEQVRDLLEYGLGRDKANCEFQIKLAIALIDANMSGGVELLSVSELRESFEVRRSNNISDIIRAILTAANVPFKE